MVSTAVYIAASVNRFSTAADSCGDHVAYASSKQLALWNVNDEALRGVYQTLPGHAGLVTCIRFISKDLIVSADDKGVLMFWKNVNTKWEIVAKLQAHSKAIYSLYVYQNLVVSGASDSLVKIWNFSETSKQIDIQEYQTIPMKSKQALAVVISNFPQGQSLILAISGTDRNIYIYIRSDDRFVQSAVLAGHEDWIRCLSFTQESNTLILASGSQDANIRLWVIESYTKASSAGTGDSRTLSDELLDNFEASLGDLAIGDEGGRQISLKRHILTVKDVSGLQQFSITFDALLVGHEAGVTSLSWKPKQFDSEVPTLLSTSTDSSVILWSPSTIIASSSNNSAIWINRQRFGDVGGQRLGGFVGGLWASSSAEVLAWGWSGGWRRWKRNIVQQEETWVEAGAIGGHNNVVKDVSWSPKGEYIMSASLDQTTRIHAPIIVGEHASWHEIARPQVHGYDMISAVFLDSLHFVSIGDEKVLRVFEAPKGYLETIESLKITQFTEEEHKRPIGASVPPLGLSNKAIQNDGEQYMDRSRRPFEGELASMTLWPETEKVFGHGYELISVAVSSSHDLIATACKASTPEHAVIRLYTALDWKQFGEPLSGHSLTVTRIAFSPDDRYILSVSRDRTWRLFSRSENGYISHSTDKSHGRIIWDCAWSLEGDVFATASRDKTTRIWHYDEKWTCCQVINTQEAATAVDFTSTQDMRYLAVGLENGQILIYVGDVNSTNSWQLQHTIADHTGAINRVAWRPSSKNVRALELASCSEDSTLRVSKFHTSKD